MSDAPVILIEIAGLVRQYSGPQPLRLRRLRVAAGECLVISGLDAGAAEAFVLLVTGAMLPEEGDVTIAGRSTRDITTDTEWLTSLDRFGIVTARAVLIDALPIASNLALPLTLSIDPIPADVRARIDVVARDAGLDVARLSAPASTLTPEERVRVHLARALANGPQVVLLEHPTATVGADAAVALGETMRALSRARGVGWIALSDDDRFARASGGTRLRLQENGDLVRAGFWRRKY